MPEVKILLADDDRVIVTTMREDLVEAGYKVISAYNGKEAVEKCQSETPDLAILDVRMPIMDGLDASSRIKSTSKTPFIFLTAYSDKNFVDRAVESGALGYLIKPVSAERMIPVIETALARARDLHGFIDTNKNLLQAVESRREIDIALGLLMERYSLGRQQSFEVLRQMARTERIKIDMVASRLVAAAEVLAVPASILNKVK